MRSIKFQGLRDLRTPKCSQKAGNHHRLAKLDIDTQLRVIFRVDVLYYRPYLDSMYGDSYSSLK